MMQEADDTANKFQSLSISSKVAQNESGRLIQTNASAAITEGQEGKVRPYRGRNQKEQKGTALGPYTPVCPSYNPLDNRKKENMVVSEMIYPAANSSGFRPVCPTFFSPKMADTVRYREEGNSEQEMYQKAGAKRIDPELSSNGSRCIAYPCDEGYGPAVPKYSFCTPLNPRRLWRDYAKAALSRYNQSNPGPDFEVVDFVEDNRIWKGDDVWDHINFLAKSSAELSPKLFFAEVRIVDREVTSCCSVDPKTDSCTNCDYCAQASGAIYHPQSGFQVY